MPDPVVQSPELDLFVTRNNGNTTASSGNCQKTIKLAVFHPIATTSNIPTSKDGILKQKNCIMGARAFAKPASPRGGCETLSCSKIRRMCSVQQNATNQSYVFRRNVGVRMTCSNCENKTKTTQKNNNTKQPKTNPNNTTDQNNKTKKTTRPCHNRSRNMGSMKQIFIWRALLFRQTCPIYTRKLIKRFDSAFPTGTVAESLIGAA